MGLVTPQEFWEWASGEPGQDVPDWNVYIQELIDGATERIETYCRRRFVTTPITYTDDRYDGSGTRILRLRQTPVVSVTAASIADTLGTFEAVDPAALLVYRSGDLVLQAGFEGFSSLWPKGYQNVKVTFSAGDFPKRAKTACRLLVGHQWFQNGRDPAAGSEAAQAFSRNTMSKIDPASLLPLPVVSHLVGLRRMLVAMVEAED